MNKTAYILGAVLCLATGYYSTETLKRPTLEAGNMDTAVLQAIEKLSYINSAFAEDGDASCNALANTAIAKCFDKNSAYAHGALQFFNSTVCMMNTAFPAQAETALCHFKKTMGVNPDKDALPQTLTKTMGSKSVTITLVAPTETFATTAGYDAKATVQVNGSNFMILYWGGSDTSSKGFMIHGANGMGGDVKKHPQYLLWDRTVATAQSIKVFAAQYTTSYLATTCKQSISAKGGCDEAIYGEAVFNSTTKSATVQVVRIENERGAGADGVPKCYRMYANGTKGGTISVAKSATAGESVSGTSVTSSGLESTCFSATDSVSFANGGGNTTCSSLTDFYASIAFAKSCDSLNSAGGTLFPSGEVAFTVTPDDVF